MRGERSLKNDTLAKGFDSPERNQNLCSDSEHTASSPGIKADKVTERHAGLQQSVRDESLISLGDAAAWVRMHSGKKTHVSTLFRWALKGCRGRKLETFLVGSQRMTSKAALCRFFESHQKRTVQVYPRIGRSHHRGPVNADVRKLHHKLYKNTKHKHLKGYRRHSKD